jgi:hypothetical protein
VPDVTLATVYGSGCHSGRLRKELDVTPAAFRKELDVTPAAFR